MDRRFQEVWSRVTAAGTGDEAQKLRAFIQDERRDAAEYARLARCTGSPRAKWLFGKLSGEEREHMKKLVAAAYLRTGGICGSVGETAASNCVKTLQALRNRYEAEMRGAEAYAAAAAAAEDKQLCSLYTQLAADERRHGEELRNLLQSMM